MHLEYLPPADLPSLLLEGFSQDADLLSTFHVEAGKGLNACVERTLKDLSEAPNTRFGLIKDDDKVVGFFGKENNYYINTIFVWPEYRSQMNVIWRLIRNCFSDDRMYTALYSKNERAIKFYLKNNGKVIKNLNVNGESAVLLEIR